MFLFHRQNVNGIIASHELYVHKYNKGVTVFEEEKISTF